jgi:superfamily II DNA or RNA helicase
MTNHTIAYNLTEFSTDIYLPSAYIVALDAAQILTHRTEKATENNLQNFNIPFTPTVKKLLDSVALLAPKNLEKKFNGTAKKPLSLLALLTDKDAKDTVIRFIYRELGAFLTAIIAENLPICVDLESKQLVHLTQLRLNSTFLQPDIYFERTAEGILYRLKIKDGKTTWRVQEKPCLLLCNDPAFIVRDGQLCQLEGINSFKLKPFRDKDDVLIPKKNVREYCQRIILPMLEKIDFAHQGFDIIQHNTVRKATLSLTHDFIQNSAGISLFFDYEKMRFIWKDGRSQKSFLDINDTENILIHHVKRNAEQEATFVQTLSDLGLIHASSNYFELKNTEKTSTTALVDWLITHKETLENTHFSVEMPVIENKTIALLRPQLNLQTTEDNDWFDLRGSVQIGDFTIPFGQLVPNIRAHNPYFQLPDGVYFLIPDEWFETYQGVAQFGKTHGETIRIKRHQAGTLLAKNTGDSTEKMDEETAIWRTPQYLKADLRPYQIEGVQWLIQHYWQHKGALLADDMGLGKSLQTIAALLFAKENKTNHTPTTTGRQMSVFDAAPIDNFLNPLQALLVLPASLVYNWEAEWRKFAPNVLVYKHIGGTRHKDSRLIKNFDVVLTTYQTVAKDIDLLEQMTWEYVVLDESQYIKNKESEAFKAVNRLDARHKISLSGTPIENSLSDLWAQMQFIQPNVLKSYAFFDRTFIKPIEKAQSEPQKAALRDLVQPFLLRRTKNEVAKDLGDVVRQTIFSEMSDAQRKLYEREKSVIRNVLLGVEMAGKSTFEYQSTVITSLMRLRQLAIHPKLLHDDYTGESAKFEAVLETWDTLRRADHKMLLFSVFTSNLALYSAYFDKNAVKYNLLTGETPLKIRQQEVINFEKNKDSQTFLMSLKAGGVGLNLTAADYVFLLDPWWNPAAEEQAIGRSHRIGQTKTVVALSFITKDTIEEKMMLLKARKTQLFTDIIGDAATPSFSKDDLAFLLG